MGLIRYSTASTKALLGERRDCGLWDGPSGAAGGVWLGCCDVVLIDVAWRLNRCGLRP